jgi:hypothetical protein
MFAETQGGTEALAIYQKIHKQLTQADINPSPAPSWDCPNKGV